MKLFPKDYEALKMYIDKAMQRKKDFITFKGIRLHVTSAKRLYNSYKEQIKE